LVLTALRAEADRWLAVRRFAATCACLESAVFDAAAVPSRFSTFVIARERVLDGRFAVLVDARFVARAALLRVFADAVPFFGGGSSTPARRASDSPIAIACFADFAPCFPCRM
jgi:hypothetical protein